MTGQLVPPSKLAQTVSRMRSWPSWSALEETKMSRSRTGSRANPAIMPKWAL
ncbi:hypothetical protein [Tautonia plasticadhaerens]|uniref:hypothetical protein n=1 Tax=Tautonia plasticadhaerens TaxID=2527974 RepID=UPI0018D25A86|nr:hypothetical protein [Tautonia plasticadhaerens]